MRYLIVGCGRVGSSLAKLLDADGHEVIVVDERPDAFKRLGQKFKGHVVVGTGIDYDLLKRAGAGTADGFVAVTDGDNRNIMAALIAKRMLKIKQIVARIYDPPRGQLYHDLGVQTVIPTTMIAKIIRDTLMATPWTPGGEAFDYGKVTSLSALIGHADAGKRIAQIERPGRIRIAALRRGAAVMVAYDDLVMQEGDEINAMVAPDAISEFAQAFTTAAPSAQMKSA